MAKPSKVGYKRLRNNSRKFVTKSMHILFTSMELNVLLVKKRTTDKKSIKGKVDMNGLMKKLLKSIFIF